MLYVQLLYSHYYLILFYIIYIIYIRGVGDNFADYWCFLLISHVILKYFQSNFYLNKLQLNVNKNMLELEVVKRI